MPVCWDRNGDWHSNVALFEAEYRAAPDDGDAVRLLANAYLGAGRTEEVVDLCDTHLEADLDFARKKLAEIESGAVGSCGQPEPPCGQPKPSCE